MLPTLTFHILALESWTAIPLTSRPALTTGSVFWTTILGRGGGDHHGLPGGQGHEDQEEDGDVFHGCVYCTTNSDCQIVIRIILSSYLLLTQITIYRKHDFVNMNTPWDKCWDMQDEESSSIT